MAPDHRSYREQMRKSGSGATLNGPRLNATLPSAAR
jgi:hypothetical protein